MIIGTGIDIIELSRIADMVGKFGDQFTKRICTLVEIERIPANDQIPFIAKRWATKEAAVKALGTGFREDVTFQDMWTTHDTLGRPILHLSPALHARLTQTIPSNYILRTHVSTSDTCNDAIAMVTLEIIRESINIPPLL
ncbi:MAG: holo-ACP synthase [Alphaproteobacteria bacterium]|nr:MAG: holo-ACP synthase [Alphaproteobacteria bacterium]